jgi:hypothetical protein
MLSQGYCKFSRGWKHEPRSPFYGAKYRNYYEVWRELCEQAGFSNDFGMTLGLVSITVSELADAVGVPHRSCLNAIKWIAGQGLIEIVRSQPSLSIAISRYEKLNCLKLYFGWESTPDEMAETSGALVSPYENRVNITQTETEKTSGAWKSIPNDLESLANMECEKTIWRMPKTSGVYLAHDEGGLMARNHRKKEGVEKTSGVHLAHKTDVLKNREENTTTLKSSSRRLAQRRKPTRTPTSEEIQLATFWHEVITSRSKSNLITVDEQVDGLISFVDKTKVSTDLIREVLTWAATNKYWVKQVRCLAELYLPSRQSKSVRRFQAMVDDWEYQQEASAKKKSEQPKVSKWAGDII